MLDLTYVIHAERVETDLPGKCGAVSSLPSNAPLMLGAWVNCFTLMLDLLGVNVSGCHYAKKFWFFFI